MAEKFGILLLYKPQGKTSHDCVNAVRRALSLKRVGHTGTLDPMAVGLLPICVGKATKLADMIGDGNKEYRAEMIFGKTTDTMDITGKVISENDVALTRDEIEAAIMSFAGKSEQTPPMYSAKKINGKKLYEYARKGKTVERAAVPIEITYLKIESVDLNEKKAVMTVGCTKGTYIRVLINDIGEKLGCGAVMTALERTKCGNFSISDGRVITEEFLKTAPEEEILPKLVPAEEILRDLGSVRLGERDGERFKNGIRLRNIDLSGYRENETVAVFESGGKLLAVGKIFREEDGERSLGVLKSFYETGLRMEEQ